MSNLLKTHSAKWTRRINDNPELTECPLMKKRFMDLVSVGALLANCLDDSRKEVKQELAAMSPLPVCTFKKTKQRERQSMIKAEKAFNKLSQDQINLQDQLRELKLQLNDRFLEASKRPELESQKMSIKEQLQEKVVSLKTAKDAMDTAQQEYEQKVNKLFEQNRQTEIDLLQMLYTYMQQYLVAVQVKLPTAALEKIARDLKNEYNIEQELQYWQRMCTDITFDFDNPDSSDTDDESLSQDGEGNNSEKEKSN
jgi:hypothetical protein